MKSPFRFKTWKSLSRSIEGWFLVTVLKEYHSIRAMLGNKKSQKWMKKYIKFIARLDMREEGI